MVFLGLMADLVEWAFLAIVVQLVLLESEGLVEILVVPGNLVSWDPEVFLGLLEMLAQLVKKDLWACLALMVDLDQLAHLDHEVKLATLDSLDPKAPLVILAKPVRKAIPVLLVLGELQVLMGTMVLKDLLDPRVSKEAKVNRALLVLQASRVFLVPPVPLEKLASQEKGVFMVNLVSPGLLVQEENVVPQVRVALLVLLVLLEVEVPLEPQGLMETRVKLVQLVLQAMLVPLALVGFQERGVLLVYLDPREKRVNRVSEVKLATLAEMVLVVLLVL